MFKQSFLATLAGLVLFGGAAGAQVNLTAETAPRIATKNFILFIYNNFCIIVVLKNSAVLYVQSSKIELG